MNKKFIASAITLCLLMQTLPLHAGSNWIDKLFKRQPQEVVEEEHYDIYALEVEENLAIPELSRREREVALKIQAAEAQRLAQVDGMEVELIRNNEVIHITIAASLLFAPNETTVLDSAEDMLHSLLPCLQVNDYYHILLIMHSDNTGNTEYLYKLTTDRVFAIYDWLEDHGAHTDFIVPYAAAGFEPIEENNSISGRAANRRLEIYLIPAEAMFR